MWKKKWMGGKGGDVGGDVGGDSGTTTKHISLALAH